MDASGALARAVVGRADELAVIGGILGDSAEGEAQTVVIAGDPGVGKTALVARACADREGSSTVLSGTCLPLASMSIPFLPIRSALRAVMEAGEDFPEVTAKEGEFVFGFDAWLDRRCAERPVVLVIDDLQWADRSTLDAIMYVIAGPSSRRLAVVATLRSGEIGLGHPLQRWLADIRRLPAHDRTRARASGPSGDGGSVGAAARGIAAPVACGRRVSPRARQSVLHQAHGCGPLRRVARSARCVPGRPALSGAAVVVPVVVGDAATCHGARGRRQADERGRARGGRG